MFWAGMVTTESTRVACTPGSIYIQQHAKIVVHTLLARDLGARLLRSVTRVGGSAKTGGIKTSHGGGGQGVLDHTSQHSKSTSFCSLFFSLPSPPPALAFTNHNFSLYSINPRACLTSPRALEGPSNHPAATCKCLKPKRMVFFLLTRNRNPPRPKHHFIQLLKVVPRCPDPPPPAPPPKNATQWCGKGVAASAKPQICGAIISGDHTTYD